MSVQIDFPIQKGIAGYFKIASEQNSIQGRLIQLLLTRKGERVMLPYFGVGVHDFLFDPLDTTSLTNLKSAIVEQISVFEPLLQVLSITAYVDNNAKPPVCHILMTIKDRKTQYEYPFDFAVKFKKPLLG